MSHPSLHNDLLTTPVRTLPLSSGIVGHSNSVPFVKIGASTDGIGLFLLPSFARPRRRWCAPLSPRPHVARTGDRRGLGPRVGGESNAMESSGCSRERKVLCPSIVAVVAGQVKNPYQDVKIVCHCCKAFIFEIRYGGYSIHGRVRCPSPLVRSFVLRSFKIFVIYTSHKPSYLNTLGCYSPLRSLYLLSHYLLYYCPRVLRCCHIRTVRCYTTHED